jgi:two-component system response regulator MprA
MEKKVLIIEDEPDIREAIAEAITEINYQVKTAENGSVGLECALKWQPDLILLDLVMPVMDGHETLRRLRQDAWGKAVQVIVFTAMDGAEDVAAAHQYNIEDYIIKAHASLDEIVNKVRLAIHTS